MKFFEGNTNKIINKDGYLFYTYGDTNYLIGYEGNDTYLVLPANYNGQNYKIYERAFLERKIISVVIPDSVTSIGYSAFYGCDSLTSIVISDGVINIGNYAFYECSSLTSVVIGNSVASIGEYAFYDCRNLANITIPQCVVEIGHSAFKGCKIENKKGFYKATDSRMCCRGYQYIIGKTFEEKKATLCRYGFHFCKNPFDLFNYYSGKIGEEVRFFKVLPEEISSETDEDSKQAAKKITFLEEIKSYKDLLN